ncbi:MAG: hypothetical protein ACRDZX_01320 [Acidimicrobiales bacterium]
MRAVHFWRLVGLEALAFDRARHRGRLGRVGLVATSAVALWLHQRRVHPEAEAVCLLSPRPVRALASGVVLVVAAISLAALPGLAGVLATAVFLTGLASLAVGPLKALPATVRLRRQSPPGHHVYLHSLASSRPGAGAELMGSVIGEADSRGWSLLLDAAGPELVHYYQRFGFRRRGGAVVVPGGPRRIRMWRPARAVVPPSLEVPAPACELEHTRRP